jgi:hypothetical protein
MACSVRLFLCARCRCQVVLCSHCDRGHRYCSRTCAQAARRHAQRAAARRYQTSRRGRLNHAARQSRYRRRRRQKVTHQGSPPVPLRQSSSPESRVSAPPSAPLVVDPTRGIPCQRCGRRCCSLVRQTFLRRHPARESSHWPTRVQTARP